MLLRTFTLLSIIFLVLFTAACTPAKVASPEQDAVAKSFIVERGKSNIYIYRNETYNFDTTMAVEIDGNFVGNTEERTFIFQSVEPGKHIITAKGENTSEIAIQTEAGKNYFIWLEVILGIVYPGAKLHQVNSATGKSGVKECQLVD